MFHRNKEGKKKRRNDLFDMKIRKAEVEVEEEEDRIKREGERRRGEEGEGGKREEVLR